MPKPGATQPAPAAGNTFSEKVGDYVNKRFVDSVIRCFKESFFISRLMKTLSHARRHILLDDEQYMLLKSICEISRGRDWVLHSELVERWPNCPPQEVVHNLANHTYIDTQLSEIRGSEGERMWRYFPNPETFSYVRQCRDSLRNLVVTSATLLVAVWTLLATLF